MFLLRMLLGLLSALLLVVAVAAGAVFCAVTAAWYLFALLLAVLINPLLALASALEDRRQRLRRRTW